MGTFQDSDDRPGIRRIGSEVADVYTPAGQQTMESHVVVPAFIALIVALVCTLTVAGLMVKWFSVDFFILMAVFGGSFLFMFLRRIGVGDKLLWIIEEILERDLDGDGDVGYAPRDIPVNKGNKQRQYLNMSPVAGKLSRQKWEQVAIAALNKRAKISRRGLRHAGNLSQSEAAAAAKILHDTGRAQENCLNGAGWDWLIVHLPETAHCLMERPAPSDPPAPSEGGLGLVGLAANQPTNQPAAFTGAV